MATIFVDEAGYTGPNLLDSDQPVFVLSSHDIDEPLALQIKKEYFGFSNASSLKFSRLTKRERSQDAIVKFLDGMVARYQDRFGVFLIHKPFAVICKLVDHVVETSMHRQGVDLYERGGNIALANALYLITKSVAGDDYLQRLLSAVHRLFVDDSNTTDSEILMVLEEKTGIMYGPEQSGPVASFLSIPQLALLNLGAHYKSTLKKNDLSVELTTALRVMSWWADRHRGSMDVIHDQSSVMLQTFDAWARVTSPTVPPILIGMDRRVAQYPIGINSTRFEEDEKWAGLQLADLVAGAFARAAGFMWGLVKERPNTYEQKLIDIVIQWRLIDQICPAPNFTPEELGTVGPKHHDPFEFFMNLVNSD